MRLISAVAFYALFSVAAAATYNVTLGKGGQDQFDPNLYVGVSPQIDYGLIYECANSLTGVVSGDVIRFQL